MTLTDEARLVAARRLIRAATGEEYGDGEMVTGYGIGYAAGNSGYHSDNEVWVTGNWNEKTKYVDGQRIVIDAMPKRLGDALERIGVNCEWLDENDQCGNCYKLIRTEPDSYAWTPQYAFNGDGWTCIDCMMEDPETFVADYVNEVTKAITWLSESQLIDLGWRDAFPDEHSAANGFHEGQNDTPEKMIARLPEDRGDWVFLITDKGQFDIHFRLFVRDDEDNEK